MVSGLKYAAALASVMLGLAVLGASAARAQLVPSPVWIPHIAIVWPRDGQGHPTRVERSHAVNVSVWPTNRVNCAQSSNSSVALYVAKDNEPGDFLTQPVIILRSEKASTFPSAEFDGISAEVAANPTARYNFVASTFFFNTWADASNVWVHAVDPRTSYPQPLVPTSVATSPLSDIDLRIQVVWPHDAQGRYAAPERATFVNVAVDIFLHGTLLSAPTDYPRPQDDAFGPYLAVAEDNSSLHYPDFRSATTDRPQRQAQQTTYTVNGQPFPRWVFNDVAVQPGRQYHFLALMSSTRVAPRMHPTIWTHAADARTTLPAPQAPPSCTA